MENRKRELIEEYPALMRIKFSPVAATAGSFLAPDSIERGRGRAIVGRAIVERARDFPYIT